VVVDHCSACAGIFLDHGELIAIAGQFQRQTVHTEQDPAPGPPLVSNETAEVIKLLFYPWWE
jgi:hypothetical protein